MRTRLAIICLAVAIGLTAVSLARSQPPGFQVSGNRVLSTNRIITILREAGWTPRVGVRGLAPLQEAYYQEGYLLAAFTVGSMGPEPTTVIVINEGEPARVASAKIHGTHLLDEGEVAEILGLSVGAPFRPRELTDRIDRLLHRYDVAGYPFAQLWVDSLGYEPATNGIYARITVVEGAPRTISGVDIVGLKKTRPDLAARISGIKEGTAYSRRVLDEAWLRLVSSRLFDEVEYPTVRVASDGQGVDAVINVVEPKGSSTFRAAVGYATPEQQGEDRILSGLVHLSLKNVGGSLKDFEVFWTNDGQQRSDTRITYHDRFFLGRQLGVGLRLEQIGQDTLYTWQSLGLETDKPVGRLVGSFVNLNVAAYVDRNVFSTGSLLRSWRYRAALGAATLQGNRRRTNYYEFDARFTYARKENTYREPDSTAALNQYIVEVRGDGTKSFGRLLHGRVAGYYRSLDSEEEIVPLSEQFYIGGARTLRGYRENQFHGRRVAALRNELLIGPGRWENGYLFADLGYVLQQTQEADGTVSSDGIFPAGFGFGLRTGSPVGNIDLSFGVDDQLSLEQTKIHVLLEQNF